MPTNETRSDFGRRAGQRLRLLGAMLAAWTVAAPVPAAAELRPLVREMLENLASLDEIGAGVSVGDFERVERAAADLDARAGTLADFDVTRLGVAARRGPAFKAYLLEQQQAARAITQAAKGQDGALVFRSMQGLLNRACVACHEQLRGED